MIFLRTSTPHCLSPAFVSLQQPCQECVLGPLAHLQCTIVHVLMMHLVHIILLRPCFLVLRLCLSPLSCTGCPVISSINVQRTRTETQRWTSILLLSSQNSVGKNLKIFKSSLRRCKGIIQSQTTKSLFIATLLCNSFLSECPTRTLLKTEGKQIKIASGNPWNL